MNKVYAIFSIQNGSSRYIFLTSCTKEEGDKFLGSGRIVGHAQFFMGEAEEGNRWTEAQDRTYIIPDLGNQSLICTSFPFFGNKNW